MQQYSILLTAWRSAFGAHSNDTSKQSVTEQDFFGAHSNDTLRVEMSRKRRLSVRSANHRLGHDRV